MQQRLRHRHRATGRIVLAFWVLLMGAGPGLAWAQLPPEARYQVTSTCEVDSLGTHQLSLLPDTLPTAVLSDTARTYRLVRHWMSMPAFAGSAFDTVAKGYAYARGHTLVAAWGFGLPLGVCLTRFVVPPKGSVDVGLHEGRFMADSLAFTLRIQLPTALFTAAMLDYELRPDNPSFQTIVGKVIVYPENNVMKADFRDADDRTILAAYGLRFSDGNYLWAWDNTEPGRFLPNFIGFCQCTTGSIGNAACHWTMPHSPHLCNEMWTPGTN